MRSLFRRSAGFLYRMILPIIDPFKIFFVIPAYIGFISDIFRYIHLCGKNGKWPFVLDLHPILFDKTKETNIDAAYFYQGIWAFEKILESKTQHHVDVASQVDLPAYLSKIIRVSFVDIRPLRINLHNFHSVQGSVTNLPFDDNSVASMSCLHVIEHVGLGRYGDSLDPDGTLKSIDEFKRVLASGGNLYLSLPIGKERVCFNAHRVMSPKKIIELFSGFKLCDFQVIDDDGNYHVVANPMDFEKKVYSTGLFHFQKNDF